MMDNVTSQATAASAIEESKEATDLAPLKTIWDDKDHLEKCIEKGKDGWRCKWCGIFFNGVNATKALFHVAKIWRPSVHVAICRAVIEPIYLQLYRDLVNTKDAKKQSKKQAQEAIADDIDQNQQEMIAIVASSKKARRGSAASSKLQKDDDEVIVVEGDKKMPAAAASASASLLRQPTMESYQPGKKTKQSTILESNEAEADAAIANMIQVKNLPINFGEDPLVLKVVSALRLVGPEYKPPKKMQLVGSS